jgi:hypothetical protein
MLRVGYLDVVCQRFFSWLWLVRISLCILHFLLQRASLVGASCFLLSGDEMLGITLHCPSGSISVPQRTVKPVTDVLGIEAHFE